MGEGIVEELAGADTIAEYADIERSHQSHQDGSRAATGGPEPQVSEEDGKADPAQRAAAAANDARTESQTLSANAHEVDAVAETARQTEAASEDGMQNLMEDFDRSYPVLHRGDIIEGDVVSIDKDGILVDIGMKSEGIIPSHEVQALSADYLQQIKIGDRILVYVLQPENQNGHVVLSLRKARAEQGWLTVQKRFEDGRMIEAQVADYNRGGLIVNIDGVRGFVPISQVVGLRQGRVSDEELQRRMAEMKGKRISLKVIEVNRDQNRLILSERLATQELRLQRKEQLLNELQEGQIRRGKVSSICDFGAFVDLGGADGLVHLSELSWGQVAHPSEVVKVGDEVDVYVLGVDREKKKIALSLRRSQPGPWDRVGERYKVGDIVTGTVTKLTSFGAFARVEDGVEGLIHVSELGEGRIPHPRSVVKEGDILTLKIIRIDAEHRKLGLSLKQAKGEASIAEVVDPAKSPEEIERAVAESPAGVSAAN